jgi:RNA polymerase sigma factor (sigma-70 family)
LKPNKHIADLQAWAQLKSANVVGLHYLYDTYAKRLLQYGLNRADTHIAQDALQDTFLTLWESRRRLGDTDSPKNYLYTTYRRKLMKRLVGDKKIDLTDDYHVFDLPVDEDKKSPEINSIRSSIEKLTTQQKEIIYLKYYQGMDYEEIAEILQMNYQSARNLMSRALKSLKAKMSFMVLFSFAFAMSTIWILIAL